MIRPSTERIATNEFVGMIRPSTGRIATNEFADMIRPYDDDQSWAIFHGALTSIRRPLHLRRGFGVVAHTQYRTLQGAHKIPLSTHGAEGDLVNETYRVAVRVGVRDL